MIGMTGMAGRARPSWVLSAKQGGKPGLDLDLRAARAFAAGTYPALSSVLNVVRATTASDDWPDGSIASVADNIARYGGGRGLLIGRGATNSIRNSTNAGTAPGTPGTLPTNWLNGADPAGLTGSVIGTGTDNGVPYIDYRLSGTSAGVGTKQLRMDSTSAIAAAVGQVWTYSSYVKLIAGSLANVTTTSLLLNELDGASAFLTSGNAAYTATAEMVRNRYTRTLSNASTAFIQPVATIVVAAGAVDITLRIGGAQLETGPLATSYIPTSTVAVTRNADQIKITGSPLTAGIGAGTAFTIFAEYEAQISTNASFVWGLTNEASPSFNESVYAATDTARQAVGVVNSGGANQFAMSVVTQNNPPALNRHVMRVAANNLAMVFNGGAVQPDTGATLPAVTLDRLVLGSAMNAPGTQALNGRLTRFAAWPSLLSDSDMVALST